MAHYVVMWQMAPHYTRRFMCSFYILIVHSMTYTAMLSDAATRRHAPR